MANMRFQTQKLISKLKLDYKKSVINQSNTRPYRKNTRQEQKHEYNRDIHEQEEPV